MAFAGTEDCDPSSLLHLMKPASLYGWDADWPQDYNRAEIESLVGDKATNNAVLQKQHAAGRARCQSGEDVLESGGFCYKEEGQQLISTQSSAVDEDFWLPEHHVMVEPGFASGLAKLVLNDSDWAEGLRSFFANNIQLEQDTQKEAASLKALACKPKQDIGWRGGKGRRSIVSGLFALFFLIFFSLVASLIFGFLAFWLLGFLSFRLVGLCGFWWLFGFGFSHPLLSQFLSGLFGFGFQHPQHHQILRI